MSKPIRLLLLALGAGLVSAIITSFLIWLCDYVNLTTTVGVNLSVTLTQGGFCSHVLWGAIWGLLFLLPLLKSQTFLRGVLFSLAPTLTQLLYFAPAAGHGLFAFKLGILAPAFIVLFNVIWGICAAYLFKVAR